MSYHLQDLRVREALKSQNQSLYVPHIVCGSDIWSYLVFFLLVEKHGKENVLLLTSRLLDRDSFQMRFDYGVSLIRGERSLKLVNTLIGDKEFCFAASKSVFFKDQRWHSFKGRSKPYKLFEHEKFFLLPGLKISMEDLIGAEELSRFDEISQQRGRECEISCIEKLDGMELVEKKNWGIKCGDGLQYQAEHLYWADGLKDFIDVNLATSQFDGALISQVKSGHREDALLVIFECDRAVLDSEKTYFIPQSQTHDHGHFIVEAKESLDDKQKTKQIVTAIIFVSEEQSSSEVLAKKIKLLKRLLDKAFNDFLVSVVDEHLVFKPHYLTTFINAKDIQVNDEQEKSLYLIGADLPFDDWTCAGDISRLKKYLDLKKSESKVINNA